MSSDAIFRRCVDNVVLRSTSLRMVANIDLIRRLATCRVFREGTVAVEVDMRVGTEDILSS